MNHTQPPRKKLLDQVQDRLRTRHYSYRTEKSYMQWIRRYILFHNKRHPKEMGLPEIEKFLTHLAVKNNVASSTHTCPSVRCEGNQALSALLFLYRELLNVGIPDASLNIVRARKPKRLPVVLTRSEIQRILGLLEGQSQLIAQLLYGSGLRLNESLRLRVKDLDFETLQITIRGGKGDQDRITMLPEKLVPALQNQLDRVRSHYQQDLKQNKLGVSLPEALDRKYPNASREWGWQYIFPARKHARDPRTGRLLRHTPARSGL